MDKYVDRILVLDKGFLTYFSSGESTKASRRVVLTHSIQIDEYKKRLLRGFEKLEANKNKCAGKKSKPEIFKILRKENHNN